MRTLIDGSVRMLWRYCRADLETIAERQGREGDVSVKDAAGAWFSAHDIHKTYGIRVGALSYWRKIGRVRAKQIPTPPDKLSAHKLLWVYDDNEIRRARRVIDGRSREARAKRIAASSASLKTAPGLPDSAEPQRRKKRRGPKITRPTLELGKFCYELIKEGVPRKNICKRVREQINRIMGESDVTTYARRYALNPDDPKPWPL